MVTGCVANVEAWLADHPGADAYPEASAALAAAQAIDDSRNARVSGAALQGVSSMVGRYLEAMSVLRGLAPEKAKESVLDEIRARRDKRKLAAEGGVDTEGAQAPGR
jgi:hypothetical protein